MNEQYRRREDSLIGQIRKNWQLLAAIVAIIAMAVAMKDKVDNHELRISKIENVIDGMDAKVDRLVDELLDKK